MYETVGRKRIAIRIDGPIAVTGDHGEYMKISGGALVEDTHGGSTSDIFPVVNRRFNTNYKGSRLSELPHARMSDYFKAQVLNTPTDGDSVNLDHAIEKLLHILDVANKIQSYGITPEDGTPATTVGELIEKKRQSDFK